MTLKQQKNVVQWGQKLKNEIRIDLTLTEDNRSDAFKDFCDDLMRLVPKISVQTKRKNQASPPEIRVGNVMYRAIPTGPELEPFLSFLSDRHKNAKQLSLAVQEQLNAIQIPAPLKVYITPFCPFCPVTVNLLLSLAAVSKLIKLTIVDGALFPETAKADHIQSAPTVLMDDQYRWTGSIQIPEIVDMVVHRDPSRLSAATLKDMCAEGDAVRVADMMLASAKIFPAFPELLVHEKWAVRLGAMVAFETVAVQNSALAAQAIPFLWNYFPKAQDTVKGDILYLMGVSGSKEIITQIETVVNGSYDAEVIEAAVEALKELRQKSV